MHMNACLLSAQRKHGCVCIANQHYPRTIQPPHPLTFRCRLRLQNVKLRVTASLLPPSSPPSAPSTPPRRDASPIITTRPVVAPSSPLSASPPHNDDVHDHSVDTGAFPCLSTPSPPSRSFSLVTNPASPSSPPSPPPSPPGSMSPLCSPIVLTARYHGAKRRSTIVGLGGGSSVMDA